MLSPVRTDQLPAEKGAGVSLWYVAMRLGVSGRSAAWICNHVERLQERHAFPKPFPHYSLAGKAPAGVTQSSRWHRLAVDAWFDGFLPPALADAARNLQLERDAARLDARAAELAA